MYVRSILYHFHTLIKFCYTKSLSDQASSLAPDWIPLLWRPRILAFFTAQQQHFIMINIIYSIYMCLSYVCYQKLNYQKCFQFSSVHSLSYVWLFVTPWTTAQQASLSVTNSWSLLKPMSIESVMPSSHLILCHSLLLLPPIPPSIRVFSNESALCITGPSLGVPASTSVLPMNTQDWCPLG